MDRLKRTFAGYFKMIKNKKGLTQQTIILLIVLLVSFAVIFMVLRGYGEIIPETLTKEACRDSALLRAGAINNLKLAGRTLIGLPELKCKTEYKCLSSGGSCREGYGKVNVINDEAIKREFASSMAECWSTLGEGKVDFVGPELTTIQNVCVICSVISFDESAKTSRKEISGLANYLSENKLPLRNTTYLQYLSNNPRAELVGVGRPLDSSKEYAVIYGVYTKEYLTNLIGATAGGVAVGGGAVFLGSKAGAVIGSVVGPIGTAGGLIVGGVAGFAAGAYGGNEITNWLKGIVSKDEAVYSLHLVEYSPQEISAACRRIDSIP